ncbi:MAG: isoaspartyl peptidase/L-asparaginase [Opitutaceae bacterium]|nr:isoaspartyl peptidase/L-asparaginase [Opitutaceae bacterium]
MKTILSLFLVLALAACAAEKPFGLVLHGGAGVIERSSLSAEREAEYRAKLTEARDAGYAVLERGGGALDAVIAVVTILEDSPLFNAGKGAVFTADGTCELDASVMDGRTQAAGAVAGVKHIKNPITLARSVMEKSGHVMLIGDGAERFAQQQGFTLVPNEYFQTEQRRQQLERAKKNAAAKKTAALDREEHAARIARYGTVGCVALDRQGNLAAGTSTGGMSNKRFGRVGDAPIIGAGTYAHNATCAVSATGWGEFFIRVGVARDIAAQLEYRGTPLKTAAAATIAKVGALGGDGGVICIDKDGNIALPFNTTGMYRAHRLSTGATGVAIFGSE